MSSPHSHSPHPNEPLYKLSVARSRTPHDRYLAYPISTSTPAQQQQQQPIYARQRYRSVTSFKHSRGNIESSFFSPSFDTLTKRAEWTSHGTVNLNDHRPDSATSSVRSQDSGVAQSDPKTSHDFSAKSEASSKTSAHNASSANTYLASTYTPNLGQHRLASSSSNQHLLHQQGPVPESSTEQLRDKLQLLNTQRLKVLRQATKSFIVSSFRTSPLDRYSHCISDEHYGQR